jgi:cytochrome oxidase Cu insertion factor (SCO1/SenC/PrrC family)
LSVAANAAPGFWKLPLQFTDENGNRAALSHWAADKTVVAMEYSACKFVCTTNWKRLLDIQAEADRQKLPVRFLVISLDPANDSPSAWRDYMKVRGLSRSNWSFLTGNRAATDKVASALSVKWWYFNETIMHDFRVVGVNAQGALVAEMGNYDDSVIEFLSALSK